MGGKRPTNVKQKGDLELQVELNPTVNNPGSESFTIGQQGIILETIQGLQGYLLATQLVASKGATSSLQISYLEKCAHLDVCYP